MKISAVLMGLAVGAGLLASAGVASAAPRECGELTVKDGRDILRNVCESGQQIAVTYDNRAFPDNTTVWCINGRDRLDVGKHDFLRRAKSTRTLPEKEHKDRCAGQAG